MVYSDYDERKYKRWRAAALTFGFLSAGLLIWGLVMHNYAENLEDMTETRSAMTVDRDDDDYSETRSSLTNDDSATTTSNDSYDVRFIDSLIPKYQEAVELARQAEQRAENNDIKKLAQKITKDGPRDIERLRSMREKID